MAFALGRNREPAPAECLLGSSLYAWRFLPLTSFKSHDNSVRDSPPSTPLSIDEGQVQRVTVISSRTRAQVGVLTEPRASLLHRCLKERDGFVFGNQRGILVSLLQSINNSLKFS